MRDDIRRWWRSKWLAPGRLARAALVDTVRSLYIPYWTFDARVHCPWQAEAGHYYYVTVPSLDAQGPAAPRGASAGAGSWPPARSSTPSTTRPVPGTQGLPLDLLRQVEPFPTPEVVPYDTAFLSGHVVEHYKVVLLIEAASGRSSRCTPRSRRWPAAPCRGDTYRNLRISPEYSGQTFKHVLVPVWPLSHDYGARAFQVIVNGYTGRIAGRYPRSPWKVALLVAAVGAGGADRAAAERQPVAGSARRLMWRPIGRSERSSRPRHARDSA